VVRGPNSYLIAPKLSTQCPLLLLVKVGLRQGSVLEIKGLKLVKKVEKSNYATEDRI